MFSVFAVIGWVVAVHIVLVYSGLAITTLLVGMYLGFSLKQLYDGYTVRSLYSAS